MSEREVIVVTLVLYSPWILFGIWRIFLKLIRWNADKKDENKVPGYVV